MVIVLFQARQALLDDRAPAVQAGLRYTAEGSTTRNDMYIIPLTAASERGSAFTGGPGNLVGTGIGIALENASTAGRLRLTSADPHIHPELDYRYLSDSWDRARMRAAVRLAIKLSQHPAYQPLVAERLTPTDRDLASDEALDRLVADPCHHAASLVGHLQDGTGSDPLAVVDQYCRVHGLTGIRVVDASVMPDVVRANTNATTIMIGERLADVIDQQEDMR